MVSRQLYLQVWVSGGRSRLEIEICGLLTRKWYIGRERTIGHYDIQRWEEEEIAEIYSRVR